MARDTAPLLGVPFFSYDRPYRDRVWSWLYVLSLVAAVVGAVYGITHRDESFLRVMDPDYMGNPANCPVGPSRRLLDSDEPVQPTQFLQHAGMWVGGSVLASMAVGAIFILGLKHAPGTLVSIAVGVQIGVPLTIALAAFISGVAPVAVPFLVFGLLNALLFCLWRPQVALVSKLLGVSAHGLNANPGIVLMVVIVQVVMSVVVVLLALGSVLALMNGHIVANLDAVHNGSKCVDDKGAPAFCCTWEPADWVPPYFAFVMFVVVWTTMLGFEIKTFVISGTMAQWYFAPVGQINFRGTTLRSVRHALGPNFGSLCFGSLVLTAVQYLRSALEQLRQAGEQNFLAYCASVCLDLIYSLIEKITQFATVYMAITGQTFYAASVDAVGLLSRNFLDTVGVWWLPGLILQTTSMILAGGWGVAVYAISRLIWGSDPSAIASSALLAILAGVLAWIVLAFFSSIVLSVVEAMYVCFALDREHHQCTKLEVHLVYTQLPSYHGGGIVENPDSSYTYAAAPSHPYAPPMQYPPAAYPSVQYNSLQTPQQPYSGQYPQPQYAPQYPQQETSPHEGPNNPQYPRI